MKKLTTRQVLKAVNSYVVFFLTVGFAVSCCMMLFLRVLADSVDLVLDADNIGVAAKLTFGNVLLITFLFGTALSQVLSCPRQNPFPFRRLWCPC